MGSYGSPKSWIPYMSSKDCSQGFCSIYCHQWCYSMFSPPPPLEFPNDNSSPNFSPLLIAIIGILASAFLLVTYYTIISKYCGNSNHSVGSSENDDSNEDLEDYHNPNLHEPWHISTSGLDETLIKSITVCKYKRGNGLVEGTDCSVCLSEFQEDESLRLLPKCSHAFHLHCIDTWLKSHSNCPLCRSNIVPLNALPLQLPTITENHIAAEALPGTSSGTNEYEAFSQDSGRRVGNDELMQANNRSKNSVRALGDLGNLMEERDTVIQVRDARFQEIRRSISMDHCFQNHILIADILRLTQDEVGDVDEAESSGDVGSAVGEDGKSSHRKRILQCVMSPVRMKRSFSSGRFSLSKHGRERRGAFPV